jgi:hypothetical protein
VSTGTGAWTNGVEVDRGHDLRCWSRAIGGWGHARRTRRGCRWLFYQSIGGKGEGKWGPTQRCAEEEEGVGPGERCTRLDAGGALAQTMEGVWWSACVREVIRGSDRERIMVCGPRLVDEGCWADALGRSE